MYSLGLPVVLCWKFSHTRQSDGSLEAVTQHLAYGFDPRKIIVMSV